MTLSSNIKYKYYNKTKVSTWPPMLENMATLYFNITYKYNKSLIFVSDALEYGILSSRVASPAVYAGAENMSCRNTS